MILFVVFDSPADAILRNLHYYNNQRAPMKGSPPFSIAIIALARSGSGKVSAHHSDTVSILKFYFSSVPPLDSAENLSKLLEARNSQRFDGTRNGRFSALTAWPQLTPNTCRYAPFSTALQCSSDSVARRC